MAAFTAERIAEARLHGGTANTALAAREVGGLIQTLQQERLLALGYLVSPSLQQSAVVRTGQTAVAETARLAEAPLTAPIIARARPQLDALALIRRSVANRAISVKAAYDAYRATNLSLIEALRLATPTVADASGFRDLLALDALMRSNEEASSAGAIIVGAIDEPEFNPVLLNQVVAANVQSLRRFRQLVGADRASLVDMVEAGDAGQRVRTLIVRITDGERPDSLAQVSEALTAALTYTGLRRLAQDRVARDVAQDAQSKASAAQTEAAAVAAGALALFLGVLALAVTVSRSISTPLQRLSRAVGVVAELSRAELVRVADSESLDRAPPELASVEVDSNDEIGELAAAVNRVQSTAAMLLERQATARSNVATMFANVSRRTQNLVGRQLQLIGELEGHEPDPKVREQLDQLEHITTRLRRSADSLMVVSGTVDQQIDATPTPLVTVVQAALAEIEQHRQIEIAGSLSDVLVAADLAGDLRLLIAELIENAANFSPPGSTVQISASTEGDGGPELGRGCTISVIDHGVGMSPTRIEEENRRLVERERLDVAPSRVLGLFVVGRLARRHNLTVRLEPSSGRGVTAVVRIPARHITPARAPAMRALSATAAVGIGPAIAIDAIERASRSGPFPWLARHDRPATGDGETEPSTVETPLPATNGRPPAPALGTPVVAAATPPAAVPPAATAPAAVPAAAVRPPVIPGQAVPDDVIGQARTGGGREGAGGLTQRVPGTHLAEVVGESTMGRSQLRDGDPRTDPRGLPPMPYSMPSIRPDRDPDAERDALNAYLSGLRRSLEADQQARSEATGEPAPESQDRPTTVERHS
jgi:signal transduction histidine kinase